MKKLGQVLSLRSSYLDRKLESVITGKDMMVESSVHFKLCWQETQKEALLCLGTALSAPY